MTDFSALAQEEITHYPGEIPGGKIAKEKLSVWDSPRLYAYALDGADKAVLIIPGGGYARVAMDHEGHDVARAFNARGYSAFVLHYRVPKDTTMEDRRYGPMQDGQQALAVIRKNYRFAKVGVLGFSAGGHLAATLSNHYEDWKIERDDAISLRPDFSILAYPVISMVDSVTHRGSRNSLIGKLPDAADVAYFSLEQQVDVHTPPAFLMHAEDDQAVILKNTLDYKEALDLHKIPNDLFIYKTGGHGFGLINDTDASSWFDAMFNWLERTIR